jgi:hypothetical protein
MAATMDHKIRQIARPRIPLSLEIATDGARGQA